MGAEEAVDVSHTTRNPFFDGLMTYLFLNEKNSRKNFPYIHKNHQKNIGAREGNNSHTVHRISHNKVVASKHQRSKYSRQLVTS